MSEDNPQKKKGSNRSSQGTAWRGSIGTGVGLVLLLHLVQLPTAAMTEWRSLPIICMTQAVYVIPAFIIALWKGHQETAKGIIIAASITALLNVACNGFVSQLAGFFCGPFGSWASR